MSESGASVERARWRARSSASGTSSARRRWSSRRPIGSRLRYAAEASNGWVKRTWSFSSSITWASSAGRRAFSPSAAAAARSPIVGCERAAAAARTSRLSGGSASSRKRTSSWSRSGTGSGSPGESSAPWASSARPSSRLKNGLPPLASWTLRSAGRGRTRSSRECSSLCTAPSASGPTPSEEKRSSSTSAAGALVPRRCASRIPTGSSRSRRHANDTTFADGGSSHWISSTATSTRPVRASSRSTPSTATATARSSRGACPGGASRSATRSASACGSGRSSSTSSSVLSTRSPRPANGKPASASAGRVSSTRNPRPRASSAAASQSVVFPAPASPSITSPRGPVATASRKSSVRCSSLSLPITSIVRMFLGPRP